LPNNRENWALYLPGDSTLRGYLPLIRPYIRVDDEKVKDVAAACANLEDKRGGLVFDEIEIRAGLVYSKSTQELIGLADRSIPVKDISDINARYIQDNLATHVFQVRKKKKKKKKKKEFPLLSFHFRITIISYSLSVPTG